MKGRKSKLAIISELLHLWKGENLPRMENTASIGPAWKLCRKYGEITAKNFHNLALF